MFSYVLSILGDESNVEDSGLNILLFSSLAKLNDFISIEGGSYKGSKLLKSVFSNIATEISNLTIDSKNDELND